jgi:hypothetical protein
MTRASLLAVVVALAIMVRPTVQQGAAERPYYCDYSSANSWFPSCLDPTSQSTCSPVDKYYMSPQYCFLPGVTSDGDNVCGGPGAKETVSLRDYSGVSYGELEVFRDWNDYLYFTPRITASEGKFWMITYPPAVGKQSASVSGIFVGTSLNPR